MVLLGNVRLRVREGLGSVVNKETREIITPFQARFGRRSDGE